MDKYIELNSFIKVNHLASTGGQAKVLIRSGAIRVNEEVETRNRRKLHAGDIVEYTETGKKYRVEEERCR